MSQRDAWLCVVDDREARLLRVRVLRSHRVERHHLEVVELFENKWEKLEHNTRSPQTGKEGHSDANLKRRRVEFLDRYARDVVGWLERNLSEHGIESTDLFAPPRLLGALRAEYPASLSKRIRDHKGDFGYMSAGELEKQSAIVALFRKAEA